MNAPRTIALCAFSLLTLVGAASLHADWITPPLKTAEGYPVPQPDTQPVLPRDHGAHPEYAIEWWYWVGHLEAIDSEQTFGFQSTVFRLAGDPKADTSEVPGTFGSDQLYMSHASLSDFANKSYHNTERIYRSGWQAKASTTHLEINAGTILVTPLPDQSGHHMIVRYAEGGRLELNLKPEKPLVIFGQRGLSRKGADPAAVSLYWTYTRIQVTGKLIRDGETTDLKGIAWMDHEISSSQLGSDLDGWDWTAIQLDDGTEVKAYRLRKNDGTADAWSAVYWINAAGENRGIYADQFEWITEDTWKSAKTGVTYPTYIRIEATDPKDGSIKTYQLRPKFDAQEFVGNNQDNPYWEGACDVFDAEGKRIGNAYLELAGYSGGLRGKLN